MKNLCWTNVLFFGLTGLVTIVGAPLYLYHFGISTVAVVLFFFMLITTLMSITGGAHRLFAHRSYEASNLLKFFYLIFGAAAFQQSCLKWASQHRVHHRLVDQEGDPYNIQRGFWWAHIGWIVSNESINAPYPEDLLKDRWVMWQHRYWLPMAIFMSFGFPTLIGFAFGDPFGGLLFGGIVRLTIGHHVTFMINSAAHMIGSQGYSDQNSSKDSWITALFTFGEGYHNFHHWYARDYRNGIRAYHWDPTKWFIRFMSWFGLTKNLKRAPEEAILRARVEMDRKRAEQYSWYGAHRRQIEQTYSAMIEKMEELSRKRREWVAGKKEADVAKLRQAFLAARATCRDTYKLWKRLIRDASRPTPA